MSSIYPLKKVITLGPGVERLPDTAQFTNIFSVPSTDGKREYVVGQHKRGRWWGCGCTGWCTHRHCKHLRQYGLPGDNEMWEIQGFNQGQIYGGLKLAKTVKSHTCPNCSYVFMDAGEAVETFSSQETVVNTSHRRRFNLKEIS